MARKPKEENEEEIVSSKGTSTKILSRLLKEHPDEHLNFEERVSWKISSGSFLLDQALGGYIEPSLIRLCGNNNEGKTPQALEIVRNFLKDVPNSRALWVLAEGRLSRQNKERCQLKFVTNPEEWEDGTVFILESNSYEFIINTIRDLVKENPENKRFVFCIDSLDGVISLADKVKKAEESAKVAGPAVLSKKMMQALSLGMFKYGHLMLLISQVTAEIKLNQYIKTPNRGGNFSGGNALLHQSDFILEYQATGQSAYILDNPTGKLNDGKTKALGKYAHVILNKSTEETTRKLLVKYPIKFGRRPSGVWTEYEIIDKLTEYDQVGRKGAWTSFADPLHEELTNAFDVEIPKQFNGILNFRQFLEENSEVTAYLFKKCQALIL